MVRRRVLFAVLVVVVATALVTAIAPDADVVAAVPKVVATMVTAVTVVAERPSLWPSQ